MVRGGDVSASVPRFSETKKTGTAACVHGSIGWRGDGSYCMVMDLRCKGGEGGEGRGWDIPVFVWNVLYYTPENSIYCTVHTQHSVKK